MFENINKKKDKQLLTIILMMIYINIPLMIISSIALINLTKISSLSMLELLQYLLGYSTINFINATIFTFVAELFLLVTISYFTNLVSLKARGIRLKDGIKQAGTNLKKFRTWKFLVKVYIPLGVIIAVIAYILTLFQDSLTTVFTSLTSNNFLLIVVLILIVVCVILVQTIFKTIYAASFIHSANDMSIRKSFKEVTSKTILNLFIIVLLNIILMTILFAGVYLYISTISQTAIITHIWTILKFIIAGICGISLVASTLSSIVIFNSARKYNIENNTMLKKYYVEEDSLESTPTLSTDYEEIKPVEVENPFETNDNNKNMISDE